MAFQDITWSNRQHFLNAGDYRLMKVDMPASVQAGDILVIASSLLTTSPGAAGWTIGYQSNRPFASEGAVIFYKVANGTEGGTQVDVKLAPTGTLVINQNTAACLRFKLTASVFNRGIGEGCAFHAAPSYTATCAGLDTYDGATASTFIGIATYANGGALGNPTDFDPSVPTMSPGTCTDHGAVQDAYAAGTPVATRDYTVDVVSLSNYTGDPVDPTASWTYATQATIGFGGIIFTHTPDAVPLQGGGGQLTRTARHMQFVNMPYEAHSAMLRRRGRRA